MQREMIINASSSQNIRVAIVADGLIESFFEEFKQDFRSRGNIYLGQVVNVENSLDACFVDYGATRHGFLPLSEIIPQKRDKRADKPVKRIEQAVKRGQKLLVQVDKESAGTKGARLTTHISLAGRYLVLMPDSETRGVSRRIEDPEQRKEFKMMTEALQQPKNMGLIVRTAGMGKNKRDLSRDMNFLLRLWKTIQAEMKRASKPGLLHADADLIQRILRDYYSTQIDQIWIDDTDAMNKAVDFFRLYMPRQRHNIKAFTEKSPIFSHFNIEKQLEALHLRRVELPSGGSLVIDPTEALVAIDVNSGKTKTRTGQEGTAYETNLEAAAEIGRQLRLRDLGGIIVLDFIDMQQAAHKREIEKALRNAMKPDKARSKISKISAFGLCTLTRQRLGKSTHSAGYIPCPTCHGDGVIRDPESTAVRLLRQIRTTAASEEIGLIRIKLVAGLANYVQNQHRNEILAIENEFGLRIEVEASNMEPGQEIIETERREKNAGSARVANKPSDNAQEGQTQKKRRRRRKKPGSNHSAPKSEVADAQPAADNQPPADKTPVAKKAPLSPEQPVLAVDAKLKRHRRRRKKKVVSATELKTNPD